jgi:TatD DNase family protein
MIVNGDDAGGREFKRKPYLHELGLSPSIVYNKRMIFDTHCHAFWNGLEQRPDEIFDTMTAEGVIRSVQVGTDSIANQKALELARRWGGNAWCSAGIHPTSCQDMPPDSAPESASQLENFINKNADKVVAVGETGLDYYHLKRRNKNEQIENQKVFFREQARLAIRLDLPLIIHSRNATADTIEEIKRMEIKRAVIHCFSEDLEFARALMEWSDGIYFSFSGILTYEKTTAIQEAARLLPLRRILVETDAPFLVPLQIRKKHAVNEPGFVRYVMDWLKELRGEPADEIEQTVWNNSNAFYGLQGLDAGSK